MKRSLFRCLLLLALICVALPLASRGADHGRLLVRRSANFGSNLSVNVNVDGRQMARLSLGHNYDGVISAGPHVVTVAVASRMNTNPASVQLNVAPGKTYQLTAGFDGRTLVLK
jgi:hypothetical protein